MKMISELSGVSIATVSRVINNNGRFSAVTRDNVLALVKKYNYSPNIVAQGLRKNRTRNIGVIVPNITNEFFAKLALHIQKVLFEANYSTLIYNTDENAVLEVEIGVTSAWLQLPAYDMKKLAERSRELGLALAIHTDRARTMTYGTPADVRELVLRENELFKLHDGGGWFYIEADNGFPFVNIEALVNTIKEIR
jgi:hypothetical protein